MNISRRFMLAVVTLAALPWLPAPVTAAPLPPSPGLQSTNLSGLEAVQYRRGWRGDRYGGGAAIGLGIAGALIGGAIIGATQQPYYNNYPPGYYGPVYGAAPGYVGGDAVAYCQQRFRSYDPYSGTYVGYDGFRHSCP